MAFLTCAAIPRPFHEPVARHALGRMSAAEKTFIPETEFPRIYRNGAHLCCHLCSGHRAFDLRAQLFCRLPVCWLAANLFGTWLMIDPMALTQHAGLAENVLDHRLNCRTVYMNPITAIIYWNMNYHVEHHMFPLVPYHALPRLHAAVEA